MTASPTQYIILFQGVFAGQRYFEATNSRDFLEATMEDGREMRDDGRALLELRKIDGVTKESYLVYNSEQLNKIYDDEDEALLRFSMTDDDLDRECMKQVCAGRA